MEEIGYKISGSKGYFYVLVDGMLQARMNIIIEGDNMLNIKHTEVSPESGGKGFGKKMVEKAVEFARENNIQIIALCPFAKSVFEKNPDLRDVL